MHTWLKLQVYHASMSAKLPPAAWVLIVYMHAWWSCSHREGAWVVLQLLQERLHVVGVHVGVAHDVHKLAALQSTHLRTEIGRAHV